MNKIILPYDRGINVEEFVKLNISPIMPELNRNFNYKIVKNNIEVVLNQKQKPVIHITKYSNLLGLLLLLILNIFILYSIQKRQTLNNRQNIIQNNHIYLRSTTNNSAFSEALAFALSLPVKIDSYKLSKDNYAVLGSCEQDSYSDLQRMVAKKHKSSALEYNMQNNIIQIKITGKP